MIQASALTRSTLKSSVRNIKAKVLYWGADYSGEFKWNDYLKSITIERIGDNGKFFGFGVTQKANIKLRDANREIALKAGDCFYVAYCSYNTFVYCTPTFKITEIHRDENTNELSVTGYDVLYFMNEHTFGELNLKPPYTYTDILNAISGVYYDVFGSTFKTLYVTDDIFSTNFPQGANLDGTETFRELLDYIAQATQTCYFVDCNDVLIYKRLANSQSRDLTIEKSMYFQLDSKTNRRLSAICHCTELGDNVEAKLDVSGTTQYVRDNPFWDTQENIGDLVNNALTAIGGLTINQFSCSWRGYFLIEPLDKIELVTKDDEKISAYLINDVLTYDGTLAQKTEWIFEESESETATNPTSLGEALKQTYARVDKANKQIEIVASETASNSASISAIRADTDSIGLSVSKLEQTTTDAFAGVNADITTLKQSASLALTEKDVQVKIEQELANGIDKVTTSTGFTFDADGLTVSKSNSDMTTQITEDGMTVYRDNTEVLVADHQGVKAKDLSADTYLIIGTNSRFENYGNNRTGCFWIGG